MGYIKDAKAAYVKALKEEPTINGLFDMRKRVSIYVDEMFKKGWVVDFGSPSTWTDEQVEEFLNKHDLNV